MSLRRALIALCVTELTSWGTLYYAFPVVLAELSRDTDWSTSAAMGAFSAGLLTNALAGVPVGRLLDRHGPRRMMTSGSVLGVGALLAVAVAPGLGGSSPRGCWSGWRSRCCCIRRPSPRSRAGTAPRRCGR